MICILCIAWMLLTWTNFGFFFSSLSHCNLSVTIWSQIYSVSTKCFDWTRSYSTREFHSTSSVPPANLYQNLTSTASKPDDCTLGTSGWFPVAVTQTLMNMVAFVLYTTQNHCQVWSKSLDKFTSGTKNILTFFHSIFFVVVVVVSLSDPRKSLH